jgi:hypothetical protein
VLLLLACAPVNDHVPPDSAGDSASSADTAGSDDTGSAEWGPTSGNLANTFTVDVSASGEDRLDALSLTSSVGTLSLLGEGHGAVAYGDQDWASAGYHLYDVLSVAQSGDSLALTYVYVEGSAVPYVYTEGYGVPVDWEYASGTAQGRSVPADAEVTLPALRALPPPMSTGIRVTGSDLTLDDTGGTMTLGGVTRSVHPMALVDCSDCPDGPWYEVHVVLAGSDACFGILYLYPDDPSWVDLEYGLCLPTLERLDGALDASWTGDLAARRTRPSEAPVHGVPPTRRRRLAESP